VVSVLLSDLGIGRGADRLQLLCESASVLDGPPRLACLVAIFLDYLG